MALDKIFSFNRGDWQSHSAFKAAETPSIGQGQKSLRLKVLIITVSSRVYKELLFNRIPVPCVTLLPTTAGQTEPHGPPWAQ